MFYPSFWLETVLTGPRVLKSYIRTVLKRNCRIFLQKQLFVCFLLNTFPENLAKSALKCSRFCLLFSESFYGVFGKYGLFRENPKLSDAV